MSRIDIRSDLLPPLVAVLLSLGLHAAAVRWWPFALPRRPAPPDTVLVEVTRIREERPIQKKNARRTPAPARKPKPAPARKRRPEPRPGPPAKPAPERTPPAPEAPSLRAPAQPPAPARPPEARPVEEKPARAKPLPPVAALMPRPGDVKAAGPPDPASAGSQEATLWLGDVDERYKGYLDRVRAAIDLSWRWREAMLAAGREGSVVVSFTLEPSGRLESVEVSESSGDPILDGEAVEAVRRAVLPPFPAHWRIRRLHLFAQFDYRME